jgi:hypothetical protein
VKETRSRSSPYIKLYLGGQWTVFQPIPEIRWSGRCGLSCQIWLEILPEFWWGYSWCLYASSVYYQLTSFYTSQQRSQLGPWFSFLPILLSIWEGAVKEGVVILIRTQKTPLIYIYIYMYHVFTQIYNPEINICFTISFLAVLVLSFMGTGLLSQMF